MIIIGIIFTFHSFILGHLLWLLKDHVLPYFTHHDLGAQWQKALCVDLLFDNQLKQR